MVSEAEAGDLCAPGAHSGLLTPVAAPSSFVVLWGLPRRGGNVRDSRDSIPSPDQSCFLGSHRHSCPMAGFELSCEISFQMRLGRS